MDKKNQFKSNKKCNTIFRQHYATHRKLQTKIKLSSFNGFYVMISIIQFVKNFNLFYLKTI